MGYHSGLWSLGRGSLLRADWRWWCLGVHLGVHSLPRDSEKEMEREKQRFIRKPLLWKNKNLCRIQPPGCSQVARSTTYSSVKEWDPFVTYGVLWCLHGIWLSVCYTSGLCSIRMSARQHGNDLTRLAGGRTTSKRTLFFQEWGKCQALTRESFRWIYIRHLSSFLKREGNLWLKNDHIEDSP